MNKSTVDVNVLRRLPTLSSRTTITALTRNFGKTEVPKWSYLTKELNFPLHIHGFKMEKLKLHNIQFFTGNFVKFRCVDVFQHSDQDVCIHIIFKKPKSAFLPKLRTITIVKKKV